VDGGIAHTYHQYASRVNREPLTDEEKQAFLDAVLEAADTGDRSKVIKFWRKHFPGYKWWLVGPDFPFVLPDDGRDEP